MKHASKVERTMSDMGDIKIFSKEMSCFFANGYGDGGNTVKIYNKEYKSKSNQFIGHFTVRKPNTVHLSGYDCEDDAVYTFGIGRWFVYLTKPGHFDIALLEDDSLEA